MTRDKIYLIRHGQTIWNRAGILQGQGNSPLTANGLFQAEAMGRALAAELNGTVPSFFASPLGRTRQTASLVAEMIDFDFDDIHYDDRLKEFAYGAWEKLSFDQIKEAFPAEFAAREADKWQYAVPGGESYSDMAARALSFLGDMGRASNGVFVVVAHGAYNRVFRGQYLGMTGPDMLDLDEPQDGFYKLEDGRETFIPAISGE